MGSSCEEEIISAKHQFYTSSVPVDQIKAIDTLQHMDKKQ